MGQSLTTYEIELAKSYIVWRSLIKAIKKDLNTISKGELVFSSVYSAFIKGVLTDIEWELKKLSHYVIRVEKTNQPTVWEVNVGRRHGFIEVNRVEMMKQFEAYVIKSNETGPPFR